MTISSLILSCAAIGLAWAYFTYRIIATIQLDASCLMSGTAEEKAPLAGGSKTVGNHLTPAQIAKQLNSLIEVYNAITVGAEAFLQQEYSICIKFALVFGAIIYVLISWGENATSAFYTTISFFLGASTSILSGYIGMKVAVFSNARTAVKAQDKNYRESFNVAFRAGSVMGFALTGLGISVLYITLCLFSNHFTQADWPSMMNCVSGFGLGGSTIALFGRVGGGIYTKAADVGADLVGKVIHGIPEDDPRNPATIADNVGDNVGDVAGMGADLFGSFAESTCAALVIASQTPSLRNAGWNAMCFPIAVSAIGIIVCLLSSFFATHISPVTSESRIEPVLRWQLIITTLFMIPATFYTAKNYLPASFHIDGVAVSHDVTYLDAVMCVSIGAVGGLIIGLVTEYYTSKVYAPVKELADKCKTGGAAVNVIYGLALGYKSCIIPVFILAGIVYVSFELCDLYGVALAAIGMLSNLATGLTIDAYGPVCDNAGGIAEMAGLPKDVREVTDALDAAGNTTAAIGKGFAIGSASLVSLALYGAFVTRIRDGDSGVVSETVILRPLTFAFLLIGAMLPYWFSALTMKSVGEAANAMVQEVKVQFDRNPRLLDEDTTERPDYQKCVTISTDAALREMIAPGALVLLSPLIAGTFFGVTAVYGLLTGALICGVQLAISMSNTGGAWDNAKKQIEQELKLAGLGKKSSDAHKAAVIGDTVGDPLKDTSGPALNILMKLMAIISLVFADYFASINNGQGVFNLPQ